MHSPTPSISLESHVALTSIVRDHHFEVRKAGLSVVCLVKAMLSQFETLHLGCSINVYFTVVQLHCGYASTAIVFCF